MKNPFDNLMKVMKFLSRNICELYSKFLIDYSQEHLSCFKLGNSALKSMILHVVFKGLGKATAFSLALPHPWHSFFLSCAVQTMWRWKGGIQFEVSFLSGIKVENHSLFYPSVKQIVDSYYTKSTFVVTGVHMTYTIIKETQKFYQHYQFI